MPGQFDNEGRAGRAGGARRAMLLHRSCIVAAGRWMIPEAAPRADDCALAFLSPTLPEPLRRAASARGTARTAPGQVPRVPPYRFAAYGMPSRYANAGPCPGTSSTARIFALYISALSSKRHKRAYIRSLACVGALLSI